MDITIFSSQFWWQPFLREARDSVNFKRYCVGGLAEYERQVITHLCAHKGRIFYGLIDTVKEPVAAAAISLVENRLLVHFYWVSFGRLEAYPLFSNIFANVFAHYRNVSFDYIQIPVPSEYINDWHRYARPIKDEHGRALTWYTFRRQDFVMFARLSGWESKLHGGTVHPIRS
jgi:hypothetical protein